MTQEQIEQASDLQLQIQADIIEAEFANHDSPMTVAQRIVRRRELRSIIHELNGRGR